ELEAGGTVRGLELPETLAVLDAMAQREPVAREPVVGRVVVGRDEEARLDRLSAQLGECEVLPGRELDLPLDGLAHVRHAASVEPSGRERSKSGVPRSCVRGCPSAR